MTLLGKPQEVWGDLKKKKTRKKEYAFSSLLEISLSKACFNPVSPCDDIRFIYPAEISFIFNSFLGFLLNTAAATFFYFFIIGVKFHSE